MSIDELFDSIKDEFKNYKSVKKICFQITDIKNEPPCVVIETIKNKEYWINTDLKLIIKELDEYDDIIEEEIKQFNDMDFLRWELQVLLISDEQ